MRDDLHRGAPVARRWRNVVRACTSDAEWQTNGRIAFDKAIAQEANEQFRNKVVRALVQKAKANQAPLPGTDPDDWLGGPLTSPERSLTRFVLREVTQGVASPESVSRGVKVALDEHLDGLDRQLIAYVQSREPANVRKFTARFRAGRSEKAVRAAAEQRARRERVPLPISSQKISLGTDLRA